jgi:hypothetical protein
MNRGFPPTALNARTGLFTPPGIKAIALWKSFFDFSKFLILFIAENQIRISYHKKSWLVKINGKEK